METKNDSKIVEQTLPSAAQKKVPVGWIIWLVINVLLLIFVLPLGIVAAIVAFIVFCVQQSSKRAKAFREAHEIPQDSNTVGYNYGYSDRLRSKLYYWKGEDGSLNFSEASCAKNKIPVKINILKDNLVGFLVTGDITTSTKVKGGGVSIGGALVGNAVAGPVGAVIGGRKKVTSETTTTDTRQVILKFVEGGADKAMVLNYSIYNTLCMWYIEKKIG